MKALEQYGPVGVRVLLATILLASGVGKLSDPAGTADYIGSAGLPVSLLLAVLAGVGELAGGAMVLLGVRARWGALAFMAFPVPATAFLHNPIGLEGMGMKAQMQPIHALKNLAIMGGLLVVAGYGSGAYSLDATLSRRRLAQPA